MVIELKVRRKDGSCGDTPLLALMEGLRYAAVVQANQRAIAVEARESWSMNVSEEPPIVQTLAPEDWCAGGATSSAAPAGMAAGGSQSSLSWQPS